MGNTRLIILVAEDDENDTFLLERAFRKNGIDLPVHVCRNGEEAMAYLRGDGIFADRDQYPFPRVLITDLKMPKCGGFELLTWLQEHPQCSMIPKIVLTASAEEQDVVRAYQLGANCYFQKPRDFQTLCEIVLIANSFWARAVLPPLPPKC